MRMTPTQPSENIKSLYIAHLRRPFAQQPARLEGATKMEVEMEQVGAFSLTIVANIVIGAGWVFFFDNHFVVNMVRWGRLCWTRGLLWTNFVIVRLVATLAV